MATVEFAANLQKHVKVPPQTVEANTIRAALDEIFSRFPEMRGYILDDQGAVRFHIAIFVNNHTLSDRQWLAEKLDKEDRVYVFQALSGG